MTTLGRSAATFAHGTAWKLGFVTLMYVDLALTLIAIQNGFIELNPFVDRLLSRPGELYLLKVAAPFLLAWLAPARLLIPSIAFLGVVALWNVSQLLALL